MGKSVDDLVESLPTSQSGSGCWARSLTGRAATFLQAVKAREATGVKLKRSAIIDTLKAEFGVTIGEEALRRHLASRCQCG